jgi:hypothetical protein
MSCRFCRDNAAREIATRNIARRTHAIEARRIVLLTAIAAEGVLPRS